MKQVYLFLLYLAISLDVTAQIWIIPPRYLHATEFNEGYAAVTLDMKTWGYIDYKGTFVIPSQYEKAHVFSEGLAAVKTNGKYGYITYDNKMTIMPQFEKAKEFSNGLAPVVTIENSQKWSYINKQGEVVFSLNVGEEAYPFSEGYACVKRNEKYGLIDSIGNWIIQPTYTQPFHMKYGMIPKEENFEWGYTDIYGTWVIPPQYMEAYSFFQNVASVKLNSGIPAYIDVKGNIVIEEAFLPLEMEVKYDIEKEKFLKSLDYSYKEDEELFDIDQYKDHLQYVNGLRKVRRHYAHTDQYGFISSSLSDYLLNYLQTEIKKWSSKQEFESTDSWIKRISEANIKSKIIVLSDDLVNSWIKKKFYQWKISQYDADHETYKIDTELGNLIVKVPKTEAILFKEAWNSNQINPTVAFMFDDQLTINYVDFALPHVGSYFYSINYKLAHNGNSVNGNVDPITINLSLPQQIGTIDKNKKNRETILSDVDINIPTTDQHSHHTFVVIIANEIYKRETEAIFAYHDGEIFQKYCLATLGIPEENIHFIKDATLNDMKHEIKWLQNIQQAYGDKGKLIFYYAGHGIPDIKTNLAYLLPCDGFASDIQSAYSLDNLYAALGEEGKSRVTLFLDACFSGGQRVEADESTHRGVVIDVEQGSPKGNMIVYAASQGKEQAYPYKEKGHGLFTYFLLKKLQATKGKTNYGELAEYLKTEVRNQSLKLDRGIQTPTVKPSAFVASQWSEWTFIK